MGVLDKWDTKPKKPKQVIPGTGIQSTGDRRDDRTVAMGVGLVMSGDGMWVPPSEATGFSSNWWSQNRGKDLSMKNDPTVVSGGTAESADPGPGSTLKRKRGATSLSATLGIR